MDIHEQEEARQLAAAVVQRCWRSFQLRRLYRFYRDLIREREKGDAATLLRMVNPQASLACQKLLFNRQEAVKEDPLQSCADLPAPDQQRVHAQCAFVAALLLIRLLSVQSSF